MLASSRRAVSADLSSFVRLLLYLVAVSCQGETPPARLRIEVISELPVGEVLTAVLVTMQTEDASETMYEARFDLALEPATPRKIGLPLATTVVKTAEMADRFWVRVQGLGPRGGQPDGVIAERSMRGGFVPEQTTRLIFELHRDCTAQGCGGWAGPRCAETGDCSAAPSPSTGASNAPRADTCTARSDAPPDVARCPPPRWREPNALTQAGTKPSVAIDDDGRALAVWVSGRAGNSAIHARRFHVRGGSIDETVVVSSVLEVPTVHSILDVDGAATVVWTEQLFQRLDVGYNLKRFLRAARAAPGTPFGQAFLLSQRDTDSLRLSLNDRNHVTAAWHETDEIVMRLLGPDSGWSAESRFRTQDGCPALELQLASRARDGRSALVWRCGPGGDDQNRLFAAEVSPTLALENVRQLSDSSRVSSVAHASYASGDVVVAWTELDPTRVRAVRTTNGQWGEPVTLAEDSSPLRQFFQVQVAVIEEQEVVLWIGTARGLAAGPLELALYPRLLAVRGLAFAAEPVLVDSEPRSGGNAMRLTTAATSTGDVLALWSLYAGSDRTMIRAATLTLPQMSVSTHELALGSDLTMDLTPAFAANARGEAVAVWADGSGLTMSVRY